MGRADLHIHTRLSDGLARVEDIVDFVERRTALDVIAVTDHEDAEGGLRARELAARRRCRFEVVPGAEVTTLQGHLLALFVERTPPSFRSVESTLEAIHAQGGLAVVPHPMSWLTRSLTHRTIERVLARSEDGVCFDAIELHNPSPAGSIRRGQARALNRRWQLPVTGGSDAHHLLHIGTGWTEFPGTTAAALRAAMEAGSIEGGMTSYPSPEEVGYGQLALGVLWGYMATPRKMLRKALQGAL